MSDAGITISIPTGQIEAVNRLLDGFKWMASDLSKPFKRFSVYYGATVMRTFKEKGRPPGSWKRLAPYTLAMRQWRNKRSNPEGILQDTGILRMSFTSEIQPQGMRYGTSVPYAVRHQVGGTISRGERTIRAKKGKALMFMVGGNTIFRKSVFQPARTFTVPARPMITWLPEDEAKLEEIVRADFEERGGFWYKRTA
jgi:phage gpG-like protein